MKDSVGILSKAAVGVIPTDTLYGLVGRALSQKAIRRIYRLKKRAFKKPFIILISKIDDLKLFNIKIDKELRDILQKVWPGKTSIILPCPYEKFSYLHRDTKTLAFRVPKKSALQKLLKKTGPLVAPSANPEGLKPAQTIHEARDYFGDKVDFYISEGRKVSLPSTLLIFSNGKLILKRKGAVNAM